jgi:hypothetical protein
MPTQTELVLSKICRDSFLSLWSHPHVYRATKPVPHELCDLLVIFDDDVIVFSDKSVAFAGGEDFEKSWGRWYRKAIRESVRQLHGALRELKERPDRIFADQACTVRLRAPLPNPSRARYHLVAVAWGATKACFDFFDQSSSGSLIVQSDLVGDEHLANPFRVGRVNRDKQFVHVFDEDSLLFLMAERDTTPDFIEYLTKRESLLTNPDCAISATGEEELLAAYLTNIDDTGKHVFLSSEMASKAGGVTFGEGSWIKYLSHPDRARKKEVDAVSYRWDFLITHLIENLRLKEASPPSSSSSALDLERVLRVMAAEGRFGRRLLAKSLSEAFELSTDLPPRKVLARVGYIDQHSDTAYVFLVAGYDTSRPYEESETGRNGLLMAYCNVLCVERPQAKRVVGLGFFAPGAPLSNEVVFLVINEHQTDEFIAETRRVQEKLQIFMDYKNRLQRSTDKEYPDAV